MAAYGIAAELAAGKAEGCGSFVPALLDEIGALDGATAARMVRIA
jgi:hydroxyethylthiazole kinase-like sugar kinase family protein